jgi:putative FmdB family regulatory protein
MPLYEYRCPTCRTTFELLRPMREAERTATCPSGHASATRVISLVAGRAWDGAAVSGATALGGGCACGGRSCGCGGH